MRDLLDRLDGWRDEQIEFLARLVNHDSGTDDVIDVNRVGAILVERLERLGFAVRRVVNDRFGDHLVGDKPGTGPKRFLFVGHYDTVFPSGTAKQRPFRIDDAGAGLGAWRVRHEGRARPRCCTRCGRTRRRARAPGPRRTSASYSTPTRSGCRRPRAR